MSKNRISIETIRIGELVQFESDFRNSKTPKLLSPITETRAIAQSKNPNAESHDVGLLIARCGSEIIGHVSVMPAVLWTGAQSLRIHWSNAFFVHPDFRTSLAAFHLLRRITSLERDLFVTGFNEPSRRICEALRFQDLAQLRFFKVDLRFIDLPSSLATGIRKMTRRSKPDQKTASRFYGTLRKMLSRWSRRKLAADRNGYHWRSTEFIGSDHEDLGSRPFFSRNAQTINWVLHNPWLRESGSPCSPAFHFSDIRSLFRYRAIEIMDGKGCLNGFAVFSITERRGVRTLKTLDHNTGSIAAIATLLDAAFSFVEDYQIDQMVVPEVAQKLIRSIAPLRNQVKPKMRDYQWMPLSRGRTLADILAPNTELLLRYEDGDCGFG